MLAKNRNFARKSFFAVITPKWKYESHFALFLVEITSR